MNLDLVMLLIISQTSRHVVAKSLLVQTLAVGFGLN
jgi:hypothetical protein